MFLFLLRDWKNIARWLTVPPPSERTEPLWLKWSLHASRTCESMKTCTGLFLAAAAWPHSFVLQGSYSAGSDLCPPREPRLHWWEGQLLQTLAAVQHSGQHAALPASVRVHLCYKKGCTSFKSLLNSKNLQIVLVWVILITFLSIHWTTSLPVSQKWERNKITAASRHAVFISCNAFLQ